MNILRVHCVPHGDQATRAVALAAQHWLGWCLETLSQYLVTKMGRRTARATAIRDALGRVHKQALVLVTAHGVERDLPGYPNVLDADRVPMFGGDDAVKARSLTDRIVVIVACNSAHSIWGFNIDKVARAYIGFVDTLPTGGELAVAMRVFSVLFRPLRGWLDDRGPAAGRFLDIEARVKEQANQISPNGQGLMALAGAMALHLAANLHVGQRSPELPLTAEGYFPIMNP